MKLQDGTRHTARTDTGHRSQVTGTAPASITGIDIDNTGTGSTAKVPHSKFLPNLDFYRKTKPAATGSNDSNETRILLPTSVEITTKSILFLAFWRCNHAPSHGSTSSPSCEGPSCLRRDVLASSCRPSCPRLQQPSSPSSPCIVQPGA